MSNNKLDYQTLQGMSVEKLNSIYNEIMPLVMMNDNLPGHKKIPFWKRIYGCVTWNDARNLMDLVAKVHNDKLPKKE